MKITTKDIVDSFATSIDHFTVGQLVLKSLNDTTTASELKESTENGIYDVKLFVNGIELDVELFIKKLEHRFNTATEIEGSKISLKILEDYKQEYRSKKSSNLKLESIKKQMEKLNVQYNNLISSVNNLNLNLKDK